MKRLVLLLALAALAACAQKDAPPQAQTAPAPEAPAAAPSAEPAGEPSRSRCTRSGRACRRLQARQGSLHADLPREPHGLLELHGAVPPLRCAAALRSAQSHGHAADCRRSTRARSRPTYPDPKYDFNGELQGEQWLNAAKFPEIAFRTTRVEDLGNQAMRVHGELTLRGVTRPIVLDATYNGGYVGHPMDPQARIGFSAHGVLRRSDFGISGGIPLAGTNMGVGDQVAVVIETEFNGPPMPKAESPKPECRVRAQHRRTMSGATKYARPVSNRTPAVRL